MVDNRHNPLISSADPLIGRTLEGYKFLSLLGSGGFGAVYLAQHPRLDLQVAVKYVRLDGTADELVDAEHEIKILSSLKHQGVVQIYDAFRYQNYQLIMMEFVPGGTLDDQIEKIGVLDMAAALETMSQVADALNYIHNRGVLHLDLKPSNVLIDPQTEQGFPRFVLTDFGIARFVQPSGHVTMYGGTPAYMSPEQFGFGDEKPDRRSDIYQFGIILYELVAGTMPFQAHNFVEYAQKHAYEKPAPPSTHRSGIPSALDDLVLKAIAKLPGERFQSIGEVARGLASLRGSSAPVSMEVSVKLMQSVKQQAEKMSVRATRTTEMKVADNAGLLDILVMAPDGTKSSASFKQNEIIVGRSKEADLPLDQKSISRKHLKIEREDNTLYVTDLGSSNGTYLDSLRLKAGERTVWEPNKRVLVEGFVLQSSTVAAAPEEPVNTTLRNTEVKRLLDHLEDQRKTPHLTVTTSPKVVYVEMGKPQTIWISVRPDDAPNARYEVHVSPGPGIDARWYTVSSPKVIPSGQTETFEVVIAAPSIDVVGGQKYEMIIEVVADNAEIPPAVQVVKLSVVPFMRFNIALNPNEVTHRRRGRAGDHHQQRQLRRVSFNIQVQAPAD
ncbi:MAG: FHA domain-containing serine/threonine-protein kinase [Anaerolineae bacterium]